MNIQKTGELFEEKCSYCGYSKKFRPDFTLNLSSEENKISVEKVIGMVELRMERFRYMNTPFKKTAFLELEALRNDLYRLINGTNELKEAK